MRLNFVEMLKARGNDSSASLSRTMVWLAFLTCTGIIIWYAYKLQLDWDMFGLYFGLTVGAYQGTAYQSRKVEEKKIEAVTTDPQWPAGKQPDIPENPEKLP